MYRLALVSLAALAFACGPQPSSYLVAVDQTALESLAGSCYQGGTAPNPPPTVTPLVQHELTVWEGAKNKHYLEIDQVRIPFPSSQNFSFSGLAEGGPKAWTYTSTVDRGNGATETRSMTVTFTELGDTLVGSIDASTSFACTSACTLLPCSVTLGLNGRRLDTQPTGGI